MTNQERAASKIRIRKLYLRKFPSIFNGVKGSIYLDEIIIYYSLN